jgi:penicillin-binding protein 1B
MQLWGGLFRQLPYEPVDLRMPDGAYWLWVDSQSGYLTGKGCDRAIQIPFIDGSEPKQSTACFAAQEEDEESFWKKLFGKKKK